MFQTTNQPITSKAFLKKARNHGTSHGEAALVKVAADLTDLGEAMMTMPTSPWKNTGSPWIAKNLTWNSRKIVVDRHSGYHIWLLAWGPEKYEMWYVVVFRPRMYQVPKYRKDTNTGTNGEAKWSILKYTRCMCIYIYIYLSIYN